VPWIDGHLPTIAARRGRGIMGLSMGGYGAMEYASRHPDMFVFAASFSGAVDLMNPGLRAEGFPTDIQQSSPYGDPVTNEVYFRGHNPTDLAGNLKGLVLDVRTGNGQPGGGDPNPTDAPADPVEMDVEQESIAFHDALVRDGITHVWDDYGAGTHAWYYWERDLRESLPRLEATLANPPAPPAAVDFSSTDPVFGVYGWRVAITRPAREFGELLHASRAGFTLTGSGSAKVITAPLFRPGTLVRAVIGSAQDTTPVVVRADKRGQLTLNVPLGPGNTVDEYSPQARAENLAYQAQLDAGAVAAGSPGTIIYTANVELKRLRTAR
jgi:pimeloyl-ACP methyl ester carboxylesterase